MLLNNFFPIVDTCLSCDGAQMAYFGDFLGPAFPAIRVHKRYKIEDR